MTEVLIVGGGPIGMRVAEKTAKAGFDTLVLEEDRKIGRPMQCAGLVSHNVVSMTGTDCVIKEGKRALINPPQGEPLVLEADEPKAYVIDRGGFDREMAKKAIKAGAELELGSKVIDTLQTDSRTVLFKKGGSLMQIEAELVIGADGPGSVVRNKAGLPGPKEFLPGIQAVIAEEPGDIHIYLGKEVTPDFFGWELPHPSGILVGLASSDGNAYNHLMKLVRRRGYEKHIIGYSAGTIPLGNMNESVRDGLMLVGDAACQVKPLSGGGLYPGLISADICAEVAVDSLEEGDVSEQKLKEYHKRWQEHIGKEISKGMWMRKIFRGLSDKNLNNLIAALKEKKVKKVIEEKGDIDYPSTLAKPVLKTSPKLIKFAGPLIKNIF